ncbi:hypothetical protein Q7C_1286 [Methylophaga frappieri]|uniref:DUF2062 domain-containing protein n=1 Tax=Methylophaga frappieri (strain ATCC BAA-2434 / DSM 25690 / JAM7) TaxID=754477 RepID=I1YHP3_METFJ|nr:DUF2062 domain-containing protein [Methylophaga frappieri]AFJ02436.1 hypothetical protein Q7C_1286 [Methylophaga frappieri]
MPRKFLKRIMPDHHAMREHPHLQRFGQRILDPQLWHLNRKRVATGLAIGLFIGLLPIPLQMLIVVPLAILLRANLPFAVMSVWITNPLTVAPIYYFEYKLGALLLEMPLLGEYAFTLSWEWFSREFSMIWQPLLLGSLICATIVALLGVVFVRIIWRLVVIRSWLQRAKQKSAKD